MAHPDPKFLKTLNSLTPSPEGLDTPSAIRRYLDGESIQMLAKEAGITPQGMYYRIKRYLLSYDGGEQAYYDLVTQALAHHVAEADWRCRTATDTLEYARAREDQKYSRWDYERRRPKLYGQRQEITEDKTIRVIIDDRSPLPVTPYIDVPRDIIPVNSEVTENQAKDQDEKLTD